MNSITFSWNMNDFGDLLDCCNRDDAVQYCLKVFNKNDLILEAGCGTGRVVKFLKDKGYNIEGMEKNGKIIKQVKQIFPELNMMALVQYKYCYFRY
jgi:16S rRNA A1518/A1519 N6-dimethyltransferase RsmA/KsgA/DIM1 with predicted DNA glycosylase/AP lyase activity